MKNANTWQSIFPCQDLSKIFELPCPTDSKISALEEELKKYWSWISLDNTISITQEVDVEKESSDSVQDQWENSSTTKLETPVSVSFTSIFML